MKVRLSRIRTIDKKRRIMPKPGVLSDTIMENIDEALKNSLALD
jgi:mRNA-degrading endonuclease toxin of MazEF toxin-antitoxin module